MSDADLDLNGLRAIADEARQIAIPIRTTRVVIRTRTWTGDQVGAGTSSDVDLSLPPYVKVREVTNEEIANSGGRYEEGNVKVGPITPNYSSDGRGGGIRIASLTPGAVSDSQEIIYILSGALTGEYRLKNADSSRSFRYMLVLERTRRAQT